jgi:hypothetical protein
MLINQGIILNVILIFAILWLANYLSEDSILNTIKSVLKINQLSLPNLIKNEKKYHIKNLNDNEASSLENFLKSLIVKNKGGKINYKKIFKPNEKDQKYIIKFLEKKISNDEHKINNTNINNILFYKKENGFEFKPFIIESKYYYNNKYKGIIKLQIEISFKFDNPDSIFISPQKIINQSGNYLIHRITFIDLINDKNFKKITSDSENIKFNKPDKYDKSKSNKSKSNKYDKYDKSNKSNKYDKSKSNKYDKSKSNKSNKSSEILESTESEKSTESNESDDSSESSNTNTLNNSDNSLIPDEIEFSTENNSTLNSNQSA